MNYNIPDNLMDNVEKNLRKHVENRKRKKHIHIAAAAIVSLLIILPISTLALAHYNNSILYKQEIDLARENKNITEVNKVFKYRDVQFTIKEILADDMGMEVIYDVSDPRYSINKVTFCDKDNKEFEAWAQTFPVPDPDPNSDNKEKSLSITINNSIADYMHNNPITLKIDNLLFIDNKKSDNSFDKLNSLIHNNNNYNNIKVDWTLKMQVPMQPIKIIPVNKEYSLDIGTLKINSFKVGVLKSIMDYSFMPKDKNIEFIHPLFSVRLDKEYLIDEWGDDSSTDAGLVDTGSKDKLNSGERTGSHGTQKFKSVYYKNPNEIGIKLIGIQANYAFSNQKIYNIDKNKLPMEFDCDGEKFKVTSVEEKNDSTEWTIEYCKTNRIFKEFNFIFSGLDSTISNSENIQFKDQSSRDKIYNSLVKKVPNLKAIEYQLGNLQNGTVITKVTTNSKSTKLIINNAVKNLIYDEEEIIIHK